MADTNRNQWEERNQTGWQQNRDNRSRDDYSSNYGASQGARYGGEDYRSERAYRNDYDSNSLRRNERRDDYSDLDRSRERSSNMGSGYDPYDYGQTVGSFNQGKEGSYRSRFEYDRDNRGYDNRDSGYDSDYNRSYGRSGSPYGSGSYGSGNYGGSNYGSSGYGSGSYGNSYRDSYQDGHSGRSWDRDADRRNMRSGNRDWWDRATDEVASWFGDDDAQHRREIDKRYGPHRGKGPKGYQRSDERIKDDVNDRLADDSFIDASGIDVTVEGSEVVLTGTVDTREEKRRAEDIAERISGVKNVENRLKVRSRENTGGATIYRDRD